MAIIPAGIRALLRSLAAEGGEGRADASIKATGKGYNARVEKVLRLALTKGEL